MRATSASILVCFAAILAAAEADWPGFRGPTHEGAARQATLFTGEEAALTLRWKRPLGSGYSALAVGDGRVMAMFAEGDADWLGAFDAATGDELWRYRVSDTYAGHDGSHDGPISTPLFHGGRVYGLGAWGHLFAVDAKTGKEIWTTHMVDDLGSTKPWYGFTTSPLMADGVLVVLIGSEEKDGKSVAGLNPDDGSLLWSLGEDRIAYHSAIVASYGGRRQLIAAGQGKVYGIDAASGETLWSHAHGGDERAMGGQTIVPVPAGDDRLFLMNKIDSSVMLQVKRSNESWHVTELWSGNGIKQSYVQPVYRDGHLYGMNNRILTCIEAATGDVKWRSREPGDGFPTLVGNHLVMMTKPGSLHVIEANPEGYRELAELELFDEHSWSEVAFASGSLYARSMAALARIDPGGAAVTTAEGAQILAGTAFGRFLAEVGQAAAADRNGIVDAFLARQPEFPIVEDSGLVHFVYRAGGDGVGIVGDMVGFRREDPMTRVDGTDLFFYTTRLEPDAAVTYGFIPDYDAEPVADPLNPREGSGLFGDVSWFAMPSRRSPAIHAEAEAARQGRLETLAWTSEVREGKERTAQVYLPAGYDAAPGRRYPVVYVHDGKAALEQGKMKNVLDWLIGRSIEPVIGVFIHADEENRGDLRDREGYLKMVVEELVPAVDERFRTRDDRWSRASVGSGAGANVALVGGLAHPGVFGRVASQSPRMRVGELDGLKPDAAVKPLVVYIDWGTYHMRSPHEAWDYADESRKLWARMREAGYRPAGGELPEGYGWACWRGHTDSLLTALFPLRAQTLK